MSDSLTFELPECLISDDAKSDFIHQITAALSSGRMPRLCLSIGLRTTDKDIFTAIQVISGINKFLEVSFQLVDDSDSPTLGYLKICQSWLPNATVLM
jgi:hypothetical protein